MANIILELEPQNKSLLFRGWMILIGIINILQSFYHQNELRYFDLTFGVILIAGGFYYWKLYQSKAVIFDEIGIKGKIKRGMVIELQWNEVSKLEASLFAILMHTKSGQKYELDLSNITFQQHKDVKPKILELAKSKNVEIVTD